METSGKPANNRIQVVWAPRSRSGLKSGSACPPRLIGVAQPRISEIARNKVDKLSLDYLMGLCAKAGVSVAVKLAT